MDSNEIRNKFLKFFEKRGHKIIPSASLVPENDPSVLFNTAGMQPLVPYLLGEAHPMGKRLVNIQKCVRTQDIDEVGDNTHDTFFEMMGNWSLGDYFKQEAIQWSYEFLTSKEEGLGLDPKRLYVTVFGGDDNAPRDTESIEIWKKYIPERRIYILTAGEGTDEIPNWWSPGDNGPCGPDSEMFYDLTKEGLGDMTKEEFLNADKEQKIVEVWNDVFMEYEKKDEKVVGKLKQRNVDTGAGLERVVMAVQGKKNLFETDLFASIMGKINELTRSKDERAKRIIADHMRTAIFVISDGVIPGNSGRGYVLRRLLRRAIRYADQLQLKHGLVYISEEIFKKYKTTYPELESNYDHIKKVLSSEEDKFDKTLWQGMREFEKGIDPFILFTTYGFPIELTEELAKEKGIAIDRKDFNKKMAEHQKLSQTSSAGMFKGGLANHNEKTIKLHTAHHLLLAGLQAVIGSQVKQRGSNITEERLRIDFLCDHKLTDEEKKKVEDWVNDKITKGLNVIRREMSLAEAHKIGAEMEFGAKYADVVSVYFIVPMSEASRIRDGEAIGKDVMDNAISKEFCGGPHVKNTSELGKFKIGKEEAVAQGIRRIKAVLVV